jgi:eukaryotic-like serine/threonine-protein kinase
MDLDATDIFVLGAVIYEMVLGRRAFDGPTEADVSAAILSSEVPGLAAQSDAPLSLDHVAQRCLAKDSNERWQTARDLLLELEWIGETASAAPVASPSQSRTQRLKWVRATALGIALVFLAALYFRLAPGPPVRPVRFAVLPPADTTLEDSAPALSADGTRLAFVATQMSQPRLWIRPIDSLAAQALPGTEGAANPFWSPDGAKVGFFSNGKLKSFDLLSGAAQTLQRFSGLAEDGQK